MADGSSTSLQRPAGWLMAPGAGQPRPAVSPRRARPGRASVRCLTAARARRLNEERYCIPEVGGSDAHYLQAVGRSFTTFPGGTAADLRAAVLAGTTGAVGGRYPSLAELGPRAIARQSWRALWATPRQVARQIGRMKDA